MQTKSRDKDISIVVIPPDAIQVEALSPAAKQDRDGWRCDPRQVAQGKAK